MVSQIIAKTHDLVIVLCTFCLWQGGAREKASRDQMVWMASQTIAKTDGLVTALGTSLFFARWGARNGPTGSNVQKIDLNLSASQARKGWLETHTEAPMTQLGRAAASNQIIDHVWLIPFSDF